MDFSVNKDFKSTMLLQRHRSCTNNGHFCKWWDGTFSWKNRTVKQFSDGSRKLQISEIQAQENISQIVRWLGLGFSY